MISKKISENTEFLVLLLVSFVAFTMSLFRLVYTDSIKNLFFVWNLFLAWIPYIISVIMVYIYKSKFSGNIKLIILFLIGLLWLLFFPNTYYLITDYIHINSYNFIRLQNNSLEFYFSFIMWYDFIYISLYAFLGFFLGVISLFKVQYLVKKIWDYKLSWLFVLGISFLTGFGIYLGRFVRFNSWDIITNPFNLILNILSNINLNSFVFSVMFGTFIFFTYLIFYVTTQLGKNSSEMV